MAISNTLLQLGFFCAHILFVDAISLFDLNGSHFHIKLVKLLILTVLLVC